MKSIFYIVVNETKNWLKMNLSEAKRFIKWAIPCLALLALLSQFFAKYGLDFLVMIFVLLVVWYIMSEQLPKLERSIRRELRSIDRTLTIGFKLEKSSDSEEEREKIRTSGAFGGMIVGGALGLPLGPLGVIIGGIMGAIIGDNLEKARIKEERKVEKGNLTLKDPLTLGFIHLNLKTLRI